MHFFDITQGKEVKKIDVNANTTTGQKITLNRQETLNTIAFCNDGCTIAVGSTAGRIVTYNLKDVKGSKTQLQMPIEGEKGCLIAVQSLLFKRPVKQQSSQ